MLFLVSGTSRSGKTLIARKTLSVKQVPYRSLDWLAKQCVPAGSLICLKRILTGSGPFVGYARISVEDKVALVKEHSKGKNDWLTSQSDEYIRDHIGNMDAYSRMIKDECEQHGEQTLMQRHFRRPLTLLTVLLSVLFVASCSQEKPVQMRAAVDALDKETAFARKARISNV